jgi:deoxyribose-phosphate aldolase
MTDVDQQIEIIAQRIQARLAASADLAPWPVRASEGVRALRAGAASDPGDAPAAPGELAALIDHTLLRPEATRDEIAVLCDEARTYRFASVCVNTTWVPLCSALLAGTGVAVCAVVGFPLGAMAPPAKAFEAREAVRLGAQEIDMVINLGALRSRDDDTVFEDIRGVVTAAAPALVKVILETSALDAEQKIAGCILAKLAGAAFVKTSTGFGKAGATVEDIALMRRVVGPALGVKASGGVRTAADVIAMTRAGATRIGASASVAIVTGAADGANAEPRAKGY